MGQAPRHLTPGLRPLRRDNLRDVVEHQQLGLPRQGSRPRDQGQVVGLMERGIAVLAGQAQLKGLLPMVRSMRLNRVIQHRLELGIDALGKRAQTRNLVQGFTQMRCQRQAQNPHGPRVGRKQMPLFVQHHHAGGQVVQNGLQIGACGAHLVHGLIHRGPGLKELLRHVCKGAGQAPQLVFVAQCGFGAEVAQGHFTHPFGQHQQGTRQLVAQQHGQNDGAQDRQKQAQGQGGNVHALQAHPTQSPLLVLAVGDFYRQGIGDQGIRHRHRHLQNAGLCKQPQPRRWHQRKSTDVGAPTWRAIVGRVQLQLVQALDHGHGGLVFESPQNGRRGALRTELKARSACTGQNRAIHGPGHHIVGTQLLADAVHHQGHRRAIQIPQRFSGHLGFFGPITGQGVQGRSPQTDPRRQSAFHLHVKPALNGARDKLIGNPVNQQPRHEANKGKDGGQLDQQLTAIAPLLEPPIQTQSGPHDHRQQQSRHHQIQGKQPDIVALIQLPVVGGLGQQKQQHQAQNTGHRGPQHQQNPHHPRTPVVPVRCAGGGGRTQRTDSAVKVRV